MLGWERNIQEASMPRAEGEARSEVVGLKFRRVLWVTRASASWIKKGRMGQLVCISRQSPSESLTSCGQRMRTESLAISQSNEDAEKGRSQDHSHGSWWVFAQRCWALLFMCLLVFLTFS